MPEQLNSQQMQHVSGGDHADTVHVRLVRISAAGEVGEALRSLRQDAAGAQSYAVIIDGEGLSPSEADCAEMVAMAAWGIRMIFTGSKPAPVAAPLTVLFERSFDRSVVATLYSMPAGKTLWLLTAAQNASDKVAALHRHALRWRASWEDPGEGDFDHVPG